ncbi:MAG: NAD(P)-dependent oxidoreductase [Candidatus Bathyarchaeota archaeon]|nr:NAD(P)-dependent oxidoreductase [Candidatus Bathyarchaeota archaeon]
MKVLVTGGNGYIGSQLVENLRSKNHIVTSYDIKANIIDDILDSERVESFIKSVDVCFHLASLCIVPDSLLRPLEYWINILEGTRNVVNACRKYSVRLIFTSTQLAGDPFRCQCCGKLQSPYAEAKREAEKLVASLPDSLTVRLPNIYDLEGKDPNDSRLFPRFGKMARERGVVRIFPPEDTPLTLVTLDECAKNLMEYIKEPKGTISMKGENLTIRQVADRIATHYGASVEVRPKE